MLIKAANNLRIPVAYHIHFGRIPQMISKNGTMWKMMKKALVLADKTIVIDKCTYDSIRNIIPGIKMQYIPNSINTAQMPIAKENSEKQITFLGWCVKTKGIEELLAAWNQVSKKSDWVLNIVGPYEKDYMNRICASIDLSKVRIMGELNHEKAMDVLNNSSVFVLPSYTEGFPMSILEAMVLKKAIIATKVGAIPEILSGNCGLLIDKQDIEQLSEAMDKYINDDSLRREHGENAQNKALSEYTDKVVYSQYRNTWDEIIGDRRHGENIV
jgi:glycosyltransferase involved in cell wall biosynthesis